MKTSIFNKSGNAFLILTLLVPSLSSASIPRSMLPEEVSSSMQSPNIREVAQQPSATTSDEIPTSNFETFDSSVGELLPVNWIPEFSGTYFTKVKKVNENAVLVVSMSDSAPTKGMINLPAFQRGNETTMAASVTYLGGLGRFGFSLGTDPLAENSLNVLLDLGSQQITVVSVSPDGTSTTIAGAMLSQGLVSGETVRLVAKVTKGWFGSYNLAVDASVGGRSPETLLEDIEATELIGSAGIDLEANGALKLQIDDVYVGDPAGYSEAMNTITKQAATATYTPKPTKTKTPTKTPAPTKTKTPTKTPAPSKTPTNTKAPTKTKTPTLTKAPTNTKGPTLTKTPAPSKTPTNTKAPTKTKTPTKTLAPTKTKTPTKTLAPTKTKTPTLTKAPTNTKGPTLTKTPAPSKTPTNTKAPTKTKTPTKTLAPTKTKTPTKTLAPTKTKTPTKTLAPTKTKTPTKTLVPTKTLTPTKTATNTITVTPTKTPTKTMTPIVTNTFTPSPSPSITFTPTASGGNTLCGTISTDRDLGSWGSPYTVTCSVTVNIGKTLRLLPGTVLKFANPSYQITVNGSLQLLGTSDEYVTLTSIKDDTVGGDTNGDADSTTPTAGDWTGIVVSDTGSLTGSYTNIRFGGYGTSYKANIYLYNNAKVELVDSIISNSKYYGIFENTYLSGKTTTLSLDKVIVSNNLNTGIFLNSVATSSNPVTILSSVITNNGSNGFETNHGKDVQISDTSITNNQGFPIVVTLNGGTLPNVNLSDHSGNLFNGYSLSGPFAIDMTLPAYTDLPYVMASAWVVNNGVILTMAPGTVVKGSSATSVITINGSLVLQGTSTQQISFTSFRDDTIGGDTNGNGGNTSPAPGDWTGIVVSDTGSFTGSYANIRFAGYGTSYKANIYLANNGKVELTDSVIAESKNYGIQVYTTLAGKNSQLNLSNVKIQNNLGKGIYQYAGTGVTPPVKLSVSISDSEISNNGGHGYETNDTSDVHLSNNIANNNQGFPFVFTKINGPLTNFGLLEASGNKNQAIYIGGTFQTDTTLQNTVGLPFVFSNLTVQSGVTLSLPAGSILKGEGATSVITINGNLIGQGTVENPITITAFSDDTVGGDSNANATTTIPVPGNWSAILVSDTGTFTGEYVNIRYAGAGSTYLANIYLTDNALVDLNNSIIEYSKNHGIVVANNITGNTSTLKLTGSRIQKNLQNGITQGSVAGSASNFDLVDTVITDNSGNGLEFSDGRNFTFSNVAITNNVGYPFTANFSDGGSMPANPDEVFTQGNKYEVVYLKGVQGNTNISPFGDMVYTFGNLIIPNGVAVSIAEGSVFKALDINSKITLNGSMIGEGTAANSLYFTSIKDDSVGGDTNKDGNATSLLYSEWSGIYVGTGGELILDNMTFKNGSYIRSEGNTVLKITDSLLWKMIAVQNISSIGSMSSVIIQRSTFQSGGVGLSSVNGGQIYSEIVDNNFDNASIGINGPHIDALIERNVIKTTYWPISLDGGYTGWLEKIKDNTFEGSGPKAIYLRWVDIYIDTTLNDLNDTNGLWGFEMVGIEKGIILTIPSGSVFKGNNLFDGFTIDGTVICLGTESEPVYFTSIEDDSILGDTEGDGIENNYPTYTFRVDGGNLILQHTIMRYGGVVSAYGHVNQHATLEVTSGTIIIDHSVIEQSFSEGISITPELGDLSVKITNSTIQNNTYDGVFIDTYQDEYIGQPSLDLDLSSNSIIENNIGIRWVNGSVGDITEKIRNNMFSGNTYGIVNETDMQLVVQGNNWGDDSGPAPYGKGDSINYKTYPCASPGGVCYDYTALVDARNWIGENGGNANPSGCFTFTLNDTSGKVTAEYPSHGECSSGKYPFGSLIKLTASGLKSGQKIIWDGAASTSGTYAWIQMNKDRTVSTSLGQAAKKPIVLVHGILSAPKPTFIFGGWDDTCGDNPVAYHYSADKASEVGKDKQLRSYFDDLPGMLDANGYDVWIAHVASERIPGPTPSIYENAECLGKQVQKIDQVSEYPGKISIVAHSMGGLVSRACITKDNQCKGLIDALITLGTPHAGTELSGLFFLNQNNVALLEMRQESMKGFNDINRNLPSSLVDGYSFLGGNTHDGTKYLFGWGSRTGDDVVNSASSVGWYDDAGRIELPGWDSANLPDRLWTDNEHGNYFTSGSPALGCVTEFLKNQGKSTYPAGCNTAIPLSTMSILSSTVTEPPISLRTYQGKLMGSVTTSHGFYVDSTLPISFEIATIGGVTDYSLQNPSGQILTSSMIASDPVNYAVTDNPATAMSPETKLLTLFEPTVGNWQVILMNRGSDDMHYSIQSLSNPDLMISVLKITERISVGDTLQFEVQLDDPNNETTEVVLSGKITYSDGTNEILEISAGLLGGTMFTSNPTYHTGYATITINAIGKRTGNVEFERELNQIVEIAPSSANISGTPTFGVVDVDKNGKYETLISTIPIAILEAGDYQVSGKLVKSGTSVATASASASLATGTTAITLEFDGDVIRNSGLSGPYTLTDLTLSSLKHGSIPMEVKTNVGTTSSYTWNQFAKTCYSLTAAMSPTTGGTMQVSPTANCGTGKYVRGTSITVTASPKAVYTLAGWNLPDWGTEKVHTFEIMQDTAITVSLYPSCYKLDVSSNLVEATSQVEVYPAPNCNDGTLYQYGTAVKVIATESASFGFLGWNGPTTVSGNVLDLTMDKDFTWVANYSSLTAP